MYVLSLVIKRTINSLCRTLRKSSPWCRKHGFSAAFDFSQRYWQLHPHMKSQMSQSPITADGNYSPTIVLYGTRNAVMHLQSCLSNANAAGLKPSSYIRLNAFISHAPIIDILIRSLLAFLRSAQGGIWNFTCRNAVCFHVGFACGFVLIAMKINPLLHAVLKGSKRS